MKAYPILRLTIFLAAGIFFAEYFRIETGIYSAVVLFVLLGGLGVFLRRPKNHWIYGIGISLFMFLVGWTLTEHEWKKVKVDWPVSELVCKGVIQETPLEKQRTYQCRVKMEHKEVLLYLPKDSLSASLMIGDCLSFRTRIHAPKSSDEVSDFDYAQYLYHKGISGTAYVPADDWRKEKAVSNRTWKQEALLFRECLLKKYRQWGIGEQQLPVLAALTLGYKGGLDSETREAYSAAGISHVLALSGMHIGIVWFLLNGVLGRFLRKRLEWLRWAIVTIALWAFAFVVGLEPSVVRAVLMCMCFGLGRLAGVRPMSVNTLAVAAFFMLLYQPFYLFDVGFQLSFVAVLSILLFYPLVYACIPVKSRLMRLLWGTTAVTLSAQVGTSPLVMYYFSDVSACFLVTNLVASILVPLIVYLAVLAFFMSPVSLFQLWVIKLLDECVVVLNRMAEWSGGLPFATFSLGRLEVIEVLVMYVTLALCWIYWKSRRRKWVIWILASCVCLLGLHLAFKMISVKQMGI